MATKNFRSTVLEPTSEFAHGDKLRFTALATVGEVLKGSFSETTIGEDGVYSVDLQYGKHRIDYKPYEGVWRHFADVEVNSDTLSTTLQDLALASVPVTDETVLVLQGILADAETAKTAAETANASAETALASIDGKMAEVEAGYPSLLAGQMSRTVHVDEINGDDSTGNPYKTIVAAIGSSVVGSSLVINCLSDISSLFGSGASDSNDSVTLKHGSRVSINLNGKTIFAKTLMAGSEISMKETINAQFANLHIYNGNLQIDYGDPSHALVAYTNVLWKSALILTGENLTSLTNVDITGNVKDAYLFSLDGYFCIEGKAQANICSFNGVGKVKIAGNRGVVNDDLRVVYRDSSLESGWTDR